MKFLYLLEGIRNPVLDFIMSAVTHLGGEIVFMAAAIVVFWCVNKKCGYYMLTSGLAGTLINQFLKILCKVPRPWVKDPKFTIVESARADAGGLFFPQRSHSKRFLGTRCTRCVDKTQMVAHFGSCAYSACGPFKNVPRGAHSS